MHDVICDQNEAFIKSIEREDTTAREMSMNDVLDGLEYAASFFEMPGILNDASNLLEFIKKFV